MSIRICSKKQGKLITLLFLFLLIPFAYSYSKPNDDSFTNTIAQLNFVPLHHSSKIQYTEDQKGNTWLKIDIPREQLNKPLIFQFLSTHVDNYCIFIQSDTGWKKVKPNTDLNGGEINSLFQENHFITATPYIYFKSTTPYINNGKYILVERSEYRGLNISNLIKVGLFYSLFLISIALNFSLYFIFRERVTLLYCLFILAIITVCSLEDGIFYFISDGHYNKTLLLTIIIPVCCILFSFFIYLFLDLKVLPKKILYCYLICLAVFTILGSAYFITKDDFYFIILISGVLVTALLTAALALYHKRDLSISLVAYSYGTVALTATGYYLSIYLGNSFLSIIDMTVIRVILAITFTISGYALWIKVKTLKLDHEYLISEFKSLKTDQEKTLYENEKYKETVSIFNKKRTVILDTGHDEVKKNIVDPKEILRDKYLCTDREIEVIICIWNGLSNQEIAEKLSISLSTTKQHVSNAYIKIEVKNRSQAMVLKNTMY